MAWQESRREDAFVTSIAEKRPLPGAQHRSPLAAQRFSLRIQSLAQAAFMLPMYLAALELPATLGLVQDQAAYQVLAIGWLVWYWLIKRAHVARRPYWTDLFNIVATASTIAVLDAGVHASRANSVSLSAAALLFASLTGLLIASHQIARTVLHTFGLWIRPTVIFGSGENAIEACKALRSEPWMGLHVVGFAHTEKPAKQIPAGLPRPFAWLDSDQNWALLRQHYHCVIALEAGEHHQRDRLIRKLARHNINSVTVVPAMRGVPLYAQETSKFQSHELLMIHLRNNLANPLHRACKRTFDLVAASMLMVLLSPVLLALAWQVKRDGGPAFFGHKRIGQGGKTFKCWKFRSMVVNAQEVLQELLANSPEARAEWEKEFKLKNDPRISSIGHFIRKTSLDELPQLWNVIKGEMSLVGPRPVIQAELERYGDDVTYYLEACPGVTGLWQVSGRNDVDYETRVYLDAWYVKNWSLWTDISILFKTVGVVLGRDGAY
ncbi:MAG: hypothetical protein RJA36_1755 [Pseudomonadota bacterium]